MIVIVNLLKKPFTEEKQCLTVLVNKQFGRKFDRNLFKVCCFICSYFPIYIRVCYVGSRNNDYVNCLAKTCYCWHSGMNHFCCFSYPILFNKSATLLNPIIIASTFRQIYLNSVAVILGALLCYFSGSNFKEFQWFFGKFLVNIVLSYYIMYVFSNTVQFS